MTKRGHRQKRQWKRAISINIEMYVYSVCVLVWQMGANQKCVLQTFPRNVGTFPERAVESTVGDLVDDFSLDFPAKQQREILSVIRVHL